MTRLIRLPKSPAVRATVALALGLVVGIAIAASSSHSLRSAAALLEPVGTLWVNSIRMTVIPLVASLLIATIATEKDLGAVGRLGGRAIAIFVALLVGIGLIGMFGGPPLFAFVAIDPASAASLRSTAAASASIPHLPTFASWLVSLVPANPIAAAVDGTMLPFIVFAVLFASGLARTAPELRQTGTEFFRAIADAMMVIVGWVLALAPIGVFALAVTLALRIGVAIVGAVGLFLAIHCGLLVVALLLLYVVVRIGGNVPVGRFARAVLPAQLVAVSTRSSLAALPAMIDGAERLHIPAEVASFALPFGVSVLRANTGISWIVSALFIAKLYGVHLEFPQVALFTASSLAMSFSVPGIPSGGLFIIAPLFLTVGLPVEGVGILIALDSIPDIFKTSVNVTAHMTATVLLARAEQGSRQGGQGAM